MESQDSIKIKRAKGKDKIKERYKKNGKYSAKHNRIIENRELNNQTKNHHTNRSD